MVVDQTSSKFVPGSKATQAKIRSTTVQIAGSTEKKAYEGKTTRCLPRVKFLESFCLSFNEKHWDNEKESLKIIECIIVPYITKGRGKLSSPNQLAQLIMDVFKGQITNPLMKKLEEQNILLTRAPENMTHLFQPLDLTLNGYFKQFMKRKFVKWYANKVTRALDDGRDLENITIDFKLSTVTPLHAEWVMEAYNHMMSIIGKDK